MMTLLSYVHHMSLAPMHMQRAKKTVGSLQAHNKCLISSIMCLPRANINSEHSVYGQLPIHRLHVPLSKKARPSLVSTQHSLSVAAVTPSPVQLVSVKH